MIIIRNSIRLTTQDTTETPPCFMGGAFNDDGTQWTRLNPKKMICLSGVTFCQSKIKKMKVYENVVTRGEGVGRERE